jgi:N-acetylglutamate synthase-like GNAT family acetyltransferase
VNKYLTVHELEPAYGFARFAVNASEGGKINTLSILVENSVKSPDFCYEKNLLKTLVSHLNEHEVEVDQNSMVYVAHDFSEGFFERVGFEANAGRNIEGAIEKNMELQLSWSKLLEYCNATKV